MTKAGHTDPYWQPDLFGTVRAPTVIRRRRVFVELFAGGAAVSMALLAPKPPQLAIYLGGKRRWAAQILPHMGLVPGGGTDLLLLNDAGTVAWAWQALAVPRVRADVVAQLLAWTAPAEELWRRLEAEPVPDDPAARAATWLCLQSGAHLGKPARADGTRWRTAGFARLSPSAVRLGFTARFQTRILAERVEAIGRVLDSTEVRVSRLSAGDVPTMGARDDVTAYLDPPYLTEGGKKRTGYGATPGEGEVPATVARWHGAGALVGVSEGRPYTEAPGGRPVQLAGPTDGRWARSHVEYLTLYDRP